MRVTFAAFAAVLAVCVLASIVVIVHQDGLTYQHPAPGMQRSFHEMLETVEDWAEHKAEDLAKNASAMLRGYTNASLFSSSEEEGEGVEGVKRVVGDAWELVSNFALGGRRRSLLTDSLLTRTSLADVTTLPSFNPDRSEFVLAALIERKAESFDLWATTFLFAHAVVHPDPSSELETFWRVEESQIPNWKQAIRQMNSTKYPRGHREVDPRFSCRITAAVKLQGEHVYALAAPYEVAGEVVPNGGVGDVNVRYRHDIIRCPLRDAEELYAAHARSDNFLKVELLKAGQSQMIYHIPWRSRVTGYMEMDNAPVRSVLHKHGEHPRSKRKPSIQQEVRRTMAYRQSGLNIDPWKGYQAQAQSDSLDAAGLGSSRHAMAMWPAMDTLYLCVPGWISPLTLNNVPHLLEFLQHHYNIGVEHIFLGAAFAWPSPHMQMLLRTLRPFLKSGKASVASHSGDNMDFRLSAGGGVAHTDSMKIFFANLVLYYAKGMAEYVAVWDFDELFIPRAPMRSLGGFLAQLPVTTRASKEAHPFCAIGVESHTLFAVSQEFPVVHPSNDTPARTSGGEINEALYPLRRNTPWLKDNFRVNAQRPTELAHRKAIHPTRRVFMAGLHNNGACDLQDFYSVLLSQGRVESESVVYVPAGRDVARAKLNETRVVLPVHMSRPHLLSDVVDRAHSYLLPLELGEILHVQFFRRGLTLTGQQTSNESHAYTAGHSNQALVQLHMKGLFHPLTALHSEAYLRESTSRSTVPSLTYSSNNMGRVVSRTGAAASEHSRTRGKASCGYLPLIAPDAIVLSARLVHRRPRLMLIVRLVLAPYSALLTPSGSKDPAGSDSAADHWRRVTATININSPAYRSQKWVVESELSVSDSSLAAFHVAIPDELARVLLDTGLGTTVELRTGPEITVCFSLPAQAIGIGALSPPPLRSFQANPGDWALDYEVIYASQRSFRRSDMIEDGPSSSQRQAMTGPSALASTHLCVASGWASELTRATLPRLLEFVQLHTLLGVSHIYLPVHIPVDSLEMRRLLDILRAFLSADQVTVFSTDSLLSLQHRMNVSGSETREVVGFTSQGMRALIVEECVLHAVHRGAQTLALLEEHHLLMPRLNANQIEALFLRHELVFSVSAPKVLADAIEKHNAQLHVPSSASLLPGGLQDSVIALPSAAVLIREYVANSLKKEPMRKTWLGDIYRQGVIHRAEFSECGFLVPLPAQSSSLASFLRAVPQRLVAASKAALMNKPLAHVYSFPHFDNPYANHELSDVSCDCIRRAAQLYSGSKLSSKPQSADSAIVRTLWPLYSSHCKRHGDSTETLQQSRARLVGSVYATALFPLVYAELAEKGLDLFVDTWTDQKEATEYSDATKTLVPFKKIYAQVMEEAALG